MKIVQANLEHLQDLAQLFDSYRIFYKKSSDINAAIDFLKARIEKEESIIFIAEENGSLVGFTQLYPVFSSTRMQRLWLLNDLFVKKEARGKGLSKMLIEKSKSFAKETNACGLTLETGKDNFVGNQLYPATQFVLDTEHNYYFWATN